MKSLSSGPLTVEVDELEYQRRLRRLYEQLHPELDPEPYLLGVAVQRVAAWMRLEMDTAVYQPAGVSIAHIRILIALAAVGPTTPTELARFTQVSPSSVSSLLRKLRRDGHVSVISPEDHADGRVKIVSLLPAGEEAMKTLMSSLRGLEERWAAMLPAGRLAGLIAELAELAAEFER
jgi:DNA-binding MarR family transcriptional regulator